MLGEAVSDVPERVRRFREGVTIMDRLLRGEVTTYHGRYYRVNEAIVQPAPVQQPRPPLTIAAHGATTLKIAAAYAASWNMYIGSQRGQSAEEVLELTRTRNELLDEYAVACGRNPREIVRSLLVGWTADTPWASVDAFQDFVGRYARAGMNEFIFPYPPEEFARYMNVPPSTVQPGIFEHVARDVIPSLRAMARGGQ